MMKKDAEFYIKKLEYMGVIKYGQVLPWKDAIQQSPGRMIEMMEEIADLPESDSRSLLYDLMHQYPLLHRVLLFAARDAMASPEIEKRINKCYWRQRFEKLKSGWGF